MICFAIAHEQTGNILGCTRCPDREIISGDTKTYPFWYSPHPKGFFYTIIPYEYVKIFIDADEIRKNLKVLPASPLPEFRDEYELVDCVVEVRDEPLDLETAFLFNDN